MSVLACGWILSAVNSGGGCSVEKFSDKESYYATVLKVKEGRTTRSCVIEIDERETQGKRSGVPLTRCYLTIYSLSPEIKPGDRIRFDAKFSAPGSEPDLPDELSLDDYFYRERIAVVAQAIHDRVEMTGEADGLLWDINRMRGRIAAVIAATSMSSSTMDFVAAVLLGDDEMMSDETRVEFSAAGLAHILALSGLHVAILAYIIAVALFPLSLLRFHRLRFVITIVLLWMYAVMTGLSPSVTRAVVMTSMILVGYLFQQRSNSYNSLCLAAILILIFSPRELYSIGFQLTFAAVTAILLFDDAITVPRNIPKLLRWLLETAKISFAAVIGTGLLSAYYFHQFPLAFLFSNIPVALVLPVFVAAAVIAVGLGLIGFFPEWISSVTDWLYGVIDKIAELTVSMPWAMVSDLYFDGWLLIPMYITVGMIIIGLYYRKRAVWLSVGVSVLVTIVAILLSESRYPHAEAFIPRISYSTSILVKEGRELKLITTADVVDQQSLVDAMKRRYTDYMRRRGIDSIMILPNMYESPAMYRSGRRAVIGDNYFVIINSASDLRPSVPKPRYALVCRKFREDIADVVNCIGADTILLSRDIDPRRSRRYSETLDNLGVPYRQLRDAPFHIVIKE